MLVGIARESSDGASRIISRWGLNGRFHHFVGPNLEPGQSVPTECGGDGDIGGVAAPRDQHPAYSRRIVARIEHLPAAFEIGFERCREIAWRVGRRRADIAEIARTVTSWDV